MRTGIFSLGLGFITLAAGAWAAPAADGDSEKAEVLEPLDVSNFPGAFVEDVFVPVPSEVFAVLDKLGEPDWRGQLEREGGYGTHSDRTLIALIFGVAVADGFLAVEAQDREAIERTGREVLRLANALGIQKAVTRHVQSILDASAGGDWDEIRRELDRTQATVRNTMEEMRDDDQARCVSIGGWLRGTQVVCSLVSDSYSTDKAELLNQPEIARHFLESVARMAPKVRGHEKMVELENGLQTIGELMEASNGTFGVDVVEEIHGICTKLIGSIEGRSPPGGEGE